MENKTKIYYSEYGNSSGRAIIFIHGWGSDGETLKRSTLKFFEQEYRCIYIDCLGCGKSPIYNQDSYISLQNAKAIEDLIFDLSLKDVIIYGHCIGGWIGTLVTLHLQNKISALLFIDGYLYFDPEYKVFITPLIRYPLYKFFFQTYIGARIINYFVKYTQDIKKNDIEVQKRRKAKVALDYIKDLYKMEKAGYREKIYHVDVPSLFAIGEQTMPVIKKSQLYWKTAVKKASTEVISNSRHYVISENPIELNQKITQFIRELGIVI